MAPLLDLVDRGPEFLSCTSGPTGVCGPNEEDGVGLESPWAEDCAQPCPGRVPSLHSRQLADDSPCQCDRWCEDSVSLLAVERRLLDGVSVKIVSFDPMVEVLEFL